MTGKTSFKEMDLNKTYIREALLLSINEKMARNGKPYVELELADGERIITARKFDTSAADLDYADIKTEDIVTVSIRVSIYNGDRSYTVEDICPNTYADITIGDFIVSADIDFEKTWRQLICNVQTCHTPSDRDDRFEPISNVTLRILKDKKQAFMHSAAGKAFHHNVIGGLLQHTADMVQAAMFIGINYPSLDRELLVCGAALHDIGKLKEMKTSKVGHVEYTMEGRLLGHALLGILLIDYYAEIIGDDERICDMERVTLLEHMLASHHGCLEYGAITEPATPEAAVLHALDMMDSRIYMFNEAYKDLDPMELSGNIFALKNSVYRPKLLVPKTVVKTVTPKTDTDIEDFIEIRGEDYDESMDDIPF